MNIIVFTKHRGSSRQFDLKQPATLGGFVAGCLALVGILFATGYLAAARQHHIDPDQRLIELQATIDSQRREIDNTRLKAQENLEALAVRVGRMQAHVIRLDALGKRLTSMANLSDGEFDFDTSPPRGGPELTLDRVPVESSDFLSGLDNLFVQLDDREQQLGVLESLLLNRNLDKKVYPAGRPVKAGWISSFYGTRRDPFTGKHARHDGVDFAGRDGAPVVSVGAGVVSWSADRYGYGNMVEVNHGNGYVTRYAHNKANLVAVGDKVEKGQAIALMGSTGRATGPNLHFEVIRNGRTVDPLDYIKAQVD
ncbi:MAG: M23 family metallopeptidase [Gammaproteobacteria bacterium]